MSGFGMKTLTLPLNRSHSKTPGSTVYSAGEGGLLNDVPLHGCAEINGVFSFGF